jgi:hypothetical protein
MKQFDLRHAANRKRFQARRTAIRVQKTHHNKGMVPRR